jgi:uncharacterized coiled-coil protein SlyX
MFKGATLPAVVAGVLATSAIAQDQNSNEALKKQLEEQKKQIEMLQKQMDTAVTAFEENQNTATASKTTLGGYGELHYNNIGAKESIDFHRFVLFLGHSYSDNLRFFSELEVEHSLAGDGKPGEVELEQAYIEYDYSANTTLKGGLFLVPVGILNETHEPDTFYGVERNPVEKNIIPATWWEAGVASNFRFADGWSLDVAGHSGLKVDADFGIRGGRQKVAKADADSMAYTARVKWTGVPGLEVAATVQMQEDITQNDMVGAQAEAQAFLYEAHVAYQKGNFGLRTLWAQWDIDHVVADQLGADVQEGFFIEPSYRLNEQFGVFARYAEWDNTAGNGSLANTKKEQVNLGVNYWLHPNVVIKFDTENRLGAQNGSGYNVGIGYQF